ncbi:MAG: hypothetical protein GWP16_01720 [Nitrospirae bacterium]|nr:hypothetical protein [Nitrospirota bacterium]
MKTRGAVLHPAVGLILAMGLAIPAEPGSLDDTDVAQEELGADSDILALVNGEPLYSPSLEQGLGSMHSGQQEKTRSAFDLRHLLDRVIDTLLVAQEARVLGMASEEPIPGQLRALRRKLALEHLQAVEVSGKLGITEEEVRGVFEKEYETTTFRIITLHDQDEARALRATLDKESDFDALAEELSKDQYSARGGLVEDVDRIDLPGAVADSIFSSSPGSILGPLQTTIGWAIVRVEAVAPADPERFDDLEKKCRDVIRFKKTQSLKKELSGELIESHSVSIDWELVDSIGYERLPDGRLRPEVADPAGTVATIEDRKITAGELGQALQLRWSGVRNETAAMATKQLVMQRLVDEELLRAESLSRGYDRTPETEKAVAALEMHLLARRYFSEVLSADIEVSDQDLITYFEEHQEAFRKPPRIQVGQITVATSEEADRIADLLRQGSDLAWLAREHSIDRFGDNGGDRGWMVAQPGIDPIQDALFDAEAGDVIGPLGMPGNFIVIRVGARDEQGLFKLEEVRNQVASAVFREQFEASRTSLIEKLRERSEIEINDAGLEALVVSGSLEEDEPAPSHEH